MSAVFFVILLALGLLALIMASIRADLARAHGRYPQAAKSRDSEPARSGDAGGDGGFPIFALTDSGGSGGDGGGDGGGGGAAS